MNYLDEFTRQRGGAKPDSFNPERTVLADWSDPDETPVHGYFEQQSSTEQYDPVRRQVITVKLLVVPDTTADIRRGDRLKRGDQIWTVEGFPNVPKNPFTGWTPGLFVTVVEGVG